MTGTTYFSDCVAGMKFFEDFCQKLKFIRHFLFQNVFEDCQSLETSAHSQISRATWIRSNSIANRLRHRLLRGISTS